MADTEENGFALERRGETGIRAIAETTTEVRRVTCTVRRTVHTSGGATATAVARLTAEARTTERGQTEGPIVATAVAPPLRGGEPLVARAEATAPPLRPPPADDETAP